MCQTQSLEYAVMLVSIARCATVSTSYYCKFMDVAKGVYF